MEGGQTVRNGILLVRLALKLKLTPFHITCCLMKITIDLPEEVFHRAIIVVAQRRITVTDLLLAGWELAMSSNTSAPSRQAALARLRKGLNLGGQSLSRQHVYECH